MFTNSIDNSHFPQMNIKKTQFQQRKDAVKAAKEAKEKAEREAAAAKAAQAKAQGAAQCTCIIFIKGRRNFRSCQNRSRK